MGRIARLDEALANQIAAGEVVERPAAVVKELLENAVDAGARRVSVSIEFGGKALIRVEDDGIGMDPSDARLCLERHATSKIRQADDLAAIGTLGFRGEALPSIASVSRFSLRTRQRGAAAGTEIRVTGGLVGEPVEVGAPEGTTIEVADLFFNLPARRKFLKSDVAEGTQVSRVVTQMALCYPELGVTLTNGRRQVLQLPPAVSLADRLFQLYGDRPDLVAVDARLHDCRLSGFVAALAEQGPVRGPQHVFVNRRMVKDRTIAHAILEAYSGASIRERSPEVHLFLEVPLDRVDVNVHPTKAEVRFRDGSLVHTLVRRGVADALGQSPMPVFETARPQSVPPSAEPVSTPAIPGVLAGGVFRNPWTSGVYRVGGPSVAAESGPSAIGASALPPDASALPTPGAPEASRPLVALGQFRDTFIIAVDDAGIVIIDQHVAHERVLFERILASLTAQPLERQRLLVPRVLELTPDAHAHLLQGAGVVERAGFEVEEFGPTSVRLCAVPALLAPSDAEGALRAIAADDDGWSGQGPLDAALSRMAATMACHAAVKANDRLSPEQVAAILDGLRETAFSTVCPHGRPVMLRLTRQDVERRFERA